MPCSATLTFPQQTTDLSLDAAIYEPVSGFIFGVRGQWITKFSAVDGSTVAGPTRYSPSTVDRAFITAMAGTLYCATQPAPYDPSTTNNIFPGDVYAVNATTLASTPLTVTTLTGHTDATGYLSITNDGTRLGVLQSHGFNNSQTLLVFLPSNVAGFAQASFVGASWNDLTYDFLNLGYWGIDPFNQNAFFIPSSNLATTDVNAGFPSNIGSGITFNAATAKAYFVNGTGTMTRSPVSNPPVNNFALTTLNTGRGAANPYRIKSCNNLPSNPYNGKVLIPAWNDDTVLVWDPVLDGSANMVVKTGFTAPIDVVHCPLVSFAVQNSSIGLKLIS